MMQARLDSQRSSPLIGRKTGDEQHRLRWHVTRRGFAIPNLILSLYFEMQIGNGNPAGPIG